MEDESRQWEVLSVVGPVFTHYGARHWDMLIASEGIIAYRRSVWRTLREGALAAFFVRARKPFAVGDTVRIDDLGDTARIYELDSIEQITTKRVLVGSNEIRIQHSKSSKPDVFGIDNPFNTTECRKRLGENFPEVYCEEGF